MVVAIDKKHTETELISLCKKGERRAQKELFEEQSPVMLLVCRRYISDDDLAEEQMLKGFMVVFDKLDQYKSSGSFQGWIRRIMVTTCLQWIRKNKQMYREVDIEETSLTQDLVVLEQQMEVDDLMRMIFALPQGYRTIFNLYAIEGYKHEEISKLLGISINTSKSQLSRARKLLQKQLADLEKFELTERKWELEK